MGMELYGGRMKTQFGMRLYYKQVAGNGYAVDKSEFWEVVTDSNNDVQKQIVHLGSGSVQLSDFSESK